MVPDKMTVLLGMSVQSAISDVHCVPWASPVGHYKGCVECGAVSRGVPSGVCIHTGSG